MRFLGIDLGWRSQPTGLCCLEWQDNTLRLLDLDRRDSIAEVLAWVDTWVPSPSLPGTVPPSLSVSADSLEILSGESSEALASSDAELIPSDSKSSSIPIPSPDLSSPRLFSQQPSLEQPSSQQPSLEQPNSQQPRISSIGTPLISAGIAVDAPTLISNPTGMRLPDRLAHQYFGRYHAGCYPANLASPFAQRTLEFGLSLEQRGFFHAPEICPQQSGRFQIEVFPHPATIHLFGLERIIKYKKGRVAERRAELSRLRDLILQVLPTLQPALIFDQDLPAIPSTGEALKAVEDQLDSLICAYVAAHWWYWGLERNWVLGAETPELSKTTGYIVVPAPVP
ncbi:MAG: DUF429 domain-containing protein [Oculatellaceae cyanobacterium Prado106]|jgi:predicted RNase H-like nuclease|nr:DUF429 domain-containing protein [Oculatellaceae cyanobacterium Prado106]